MRENGEIDKESYRNVRDLLKGIVKKREEEQDKQLFLSQPKQEIDLLIIKQHGIKDAKIDSGRIIIVFEDGKELEIRSDEVHGLQTIYDNVAFIEKDGL